MPAQQYEINAICSCLTSLKIRTSKDLNEKMEKVIANIIQNPKVFKSKYTPAQCYKLFEKAIKSYNDVNAFNIHITDNNLASFEKDLKNNSNKNVAEIPKDDLSKVTKSYDRLSNAFAKKKTKIEDMNALLESKDIITCQHVIVGAGDTGTTIWMEKFKDYHNKVNEKISQRKTPEVLMIADGTGSWKHDYTLAQPHNILERPSLPYNPSDYMGPAYFANPYANARHVYQTNQVSLMKTDAPLVDGIVLKIEKKVNHLSDWKSPNENYRLKLKTAKGEKEVYTNNLNICSGLGPAKETTARNLLSKNEFEELSQFDSKKGFTPVVDGNHFILSDSEEKGKPRKIIIYGGGGTAAACYRKGFFGHDIHTEGRKFNEKSQKNTVIWIAKQFNKAGTGKLATTALNTAKTRGELLQGELTKIEPKDDKLSLVFKKVDPKTNIASSDTFNIECDQLIHSIGQDDSKMRAVCQEIDPDLHCNYDPNGMILNVGSNDDKVFFYGAAAMAVREQEYTESTWKWLKSQNIGGDVGPGSMPPSRAQIRQDKALRGGSVDSINANMDNSNLIKQYLGDAGVAPSVASAFVDDLLLARKHSTSGCTKKMLHDLLIKHNLGNALIIRGHGHLVANPPQAAEPLKRKASSDAGPSSYKKRRM